MRGGRGPARRTTTPLGGAGDSAEAIRATADHTYRRGRKRLSTTSGSRTDTASPIARTGPDNRRATRIPAHHPAVPPEDGGSGSPKDQGARGERGTTCATTTPSGFGGTDHTDRRDRNGLVRTAAPPGRTTTTGSDRRTTATPPPRPATPSPSTARSGT